MKLAPETETVAAVLPSKLSQAVKRRAQEEGRTVSNYIRQVLVNAVEAQHHEPGTLADTAPDTVERVTR
jgi:hypothetical protein